MGSEDMKDYESLKKEYGIEELFLESERPERKVNLPGFNIDKYEVTNRAYNLFVSNTGNPPPPHWKNGSYPPTADMHPVTNVSWYDAFEFCKALGKRLPTEEEWEKAARGPKGNRFSWGNNFDTKKSNLDKGTTVAIDSLDEDISFYGVRGLTGNVMEWTDSWFNAYPDAKVQSEQYGKKNKVIKGWSGTDVRHYNMAYINARSSSRHYLAPDNISDDIGFRCAWD
jgi:formylglycine-generating enzyme required for sulfatase activity